VKARRHERKQGQSKELNKRAGNSLSEHLHKDLLRRFRLLFQQYHVVLKQVIRAARALERAALSGPGRLGFLEHKDGAAVRNRRRSKRRS
jgi:hypothetical protein